VSKESQRRRAKLAKTRRGDVPRTTRRDRSNIRDIWKLLNTPLAITVISTLIIGGAGKLILSEQERLKRINDNKQALRQLIVEYYSRTRIIEQYTGDLIDYVIDSNAQPQPDRNTKSDPDELDMVEYAFECLSLGGIEEIKSRASQPSRYLTQVTQKNKKETEILKPGVVAALNGSPPYVPTRPEFAGISVSSVMDQIESLDPTKWAAYHLVRLDGKVVRVHDTTTKDNEYAITPIQVAYTGIFSARGYRNLCDEIIRSRQLLLYGRARTDESLFTFDDDILDPAVSELQLARSSRTRR
jgi:hypothetical protein